MDPCQIHMYMYTHIQTISPKTMMYTIHYMRIIYTTEFSNLGVNNFWVEKGCVSIAYIRILNTDMKTHSIDVLHIYSFCCKHVEYCCVIAHSCTVVSYSLSAFAPVIDISTLVQYKYTYIHKAYVPRGSVNHSLQLHTNPQASILYGWYIHTL